MFEMWKKPAVYHAVAYQLITNDSQFHPMHRFQWGEIHLQTIRDLIVAKIGPLLRKPLLPT
jgi:hypothetical protein